MLSAGEGEGSPFGRRSFEGYAERLERVVVAVEEAPRRLIGVPKEGGEGDARALEGEALVVRDAAPEEEAEDGVRLDGGGERGGVGAVPERRVAAARTPSQQRDPQRRRPAHIQAGVRSAGIAVAGAPALWQRAGG